LLRRYAPRNDGKYRRLKLWVKYGEFQAL